jgi:hypothetical protein
LGLFPLAQELGFLQGKETRYPNVALFTGCSSEARPLHPFPSAVNSSALKLVLEFKRVQRRKQDDAKYSE